MMSKELLAQVAVWANMGPGGPQAGLREAVK